MSEIRRVGKSYQQHQPSIKKVGFSHPTNLPTEWIRVPLTNIVELNKKVKLEDELEIGFTPMSDVPTTFYEKPVFKKRLWSEVKRGYTQFQNGDVIFAKITPCFENSKAAIVEEYPNGFGAGSTEYYVLRPILGSIDPRLILCFVKSREFLISGATNMSGSVGHKRVPKDFVSNYPFPLAPLSEQKEIATRLDNLLAQVDTLKNRLDAIPTLLKRFRQSVLATAVSGKLTEDWKENDTQIKKDYDMEVSIGHKQNKKIEVTSNHDVVTNYFPKHWYVSDFNELYCFIDYRGKTPKKTISGTRLITAKNIRMGYLNDEPIEYMSNEDYKKWMTRGFPKANDILFVTEGHTMGFVALNTRKDIFALAQRTLTLQPYGKVNPKFHYYYMMSNSFQKVVALNATGTAAKGIKAAKFRGLPLPFPSYGEQTEIVTRVENLFAFADKIENSLKQAQEQANKLTPSLLAKAFRGELTTDWRKQNPDLITGKNSAEALLARIKAEQKKLKPKHKIRKKKA
ncbi:MAG: restriction endonuclease subunit S [Cocleimonas sp.]|nr:restriction endonuclease subunit S [Cocleimonas sp.]